MRVYDLPPALGRDGLAWAGRGEERRLLATLLKPAFLRALAGWAVLGLLTIVLWPTFLIAAGIVALVVVAFRSAPHRTPTIG
jgi:hypothetical protein